MPNKPAKDSDPLKGKKTGKWSKYGGAVNGMRKAELSEWSCQLCGRVSPKELPPYLIEFLPDDFIRICNSCYNVKTVKRVTTVQRLITIVRSDKRD